ncbi:MAG: hypothetical protein EBX50_10450 [Chitinophagia bacterium]|nr:hypothetical protein [Chitinophagia bacterium]
MKDFNAANQISGIRKQLIRLLLPMSDSICGYTPEDLIEAFSYYEVMDSCQLACTGILRSDAVVNEIFGRTRGMVGQNAPVFLNAYNLMAIFKQLVMRTAKARKLSSKWCYYISIEIFMVMCGSLKVIKMSACGIQLFLAYFFEKLTTLFICRSIILNY